MPRLLTLALLISIASISTARVAAEPKIERGICPGVAVTAFEQRLPHEVKRYPFEQALLKPFVDLWLSGQRPTLPARPERVMVYSVPGHPFLIGYQSGPCMIASLSVARERLLQWLGPRIGWSI